MFLKQKSAVYWVLAALLFLALRPYLGVRHDGILYLAQAFTRLYPGVFSQDLFFRYGSQDAYSAFGVLYAHAIQWFGVEKASIAGVLLGQLAWIAAAVAWILVSLPPPARLIAAFCVALSAGTYGGFNLIHYGEPFLTGRTFAEPLTVAALAAFVAGRRTLSLVLLAAAFMLHPLMALPGLGLLWLTKLREDRRWALVLLGAFPALIAAYCDVGPFGKLLTVYDAEWRATVELNNFVFMLHWPLASWLALAADGAMLVFIAYRHGPGRLWAQNVLAGLVIACVVSIIGADLLSNVMITSVQLWRFQWIAHFVAITLLAPHLLRALQGSAAERLGVALWVYGLMFQETVSGAAALVFGLLIVQFGTRWVVSKATLYFGLLGLVASGLRQWQLAVNELMRLITALGNEATLGWLERVVIWLQQAPVGPVLVALVLGGLLYRTRSWRAAGLVILVLAAGLTATRWDRRPEIAKVAERGLVDGGSLFSQYVPEDAEVYWQGDAIAPWMLMHRRSYASGIQAAGVVFNRGTALEIVRRREVTGILDMQTDVCQLLGVLRGEVSKSCAPDLFALQVTCEEDKALDYIVIGEKIENYAVAHWTPFPERGAQAKSYYLYRCAALPASQ